MNLKEMMKTEYLLLAALISIYTLSASAQNVTVPKEDIFWNNPDFWESPAMKTPYKPDLTPEEKIAGLSKFWSEAKYNFVYFHLVPDLDWDKTYLEYIPRVVATKSTLEYYRVLQEFCAKLKDGHTNIWPARELDDEIYSRPPISTRLVENKVIVTNVIAKSEETAAISVGDEVVSIEGVPAKEYAEKNIKPYLSESTPQAFDQSLYSRWLLLGPANSTVRIQLRSTTGNTYNVVLKRMRWQELNKLVTPLDDFEMKELPDGVVHLKIRSFEGYSDPKIKDTGQIFAERYAEFENAPALILDLRDNTGGNSRVGYKILAHLTEERFKGSRWYTRNYRPSFRAWQREQEVFGDNAWQATEKDLAELRGANVKVYKGKVIVLTSPRTASAAEDFLVAFKPLNRGAIIGEPSNGSTGQPLIISLPGGGIGRICTKADTFADGTRFVGIGVLPDIAAAPRISDYTDKTDTVLQRALDELAKMK